MEDLKGLPRSSTVLSSSPPRRLLVDVPAHVVASRVRLRIHENEEPREVPA